MTESPAREGLRSGIALFVCVGAIYALTAARTVLGGDNGEFATVATFGGVPHPSGYPLYALYLRATAWLPGSAAHAAALSTTLLGAAAVVVARQAARAWGASNFGASLAASAFAFGRLPWLMATHAEVFALHSLLAAGIVLAAGPDAPVRGRKRVALLALLAGFGLSNNHSLVMLAPLGLWGAVTGVRELRAGGTPAPQAWGQGLSAGIAALCIGLSPYLSLLLQAEHPVWAWGNTGTVSGLLHHFLRADYGTTSLAISDAGASGAEHVARLLGILTSELHVILWGPVLLGWFHLVARAPRPRRVDGVVFTLTWVLCGPFFVSLFNLPIEGLAGHVVERFYLLPLTLLVVPLAVGCDRLLPQSMRDLHVALPIAVALACLGLFRHLDAVREHHAPFMQHYLVHTLRTVPEGGVLLGQGDHEVFGFLYAQAVLGERPDVVYVNAPLLAYDWYRARISDRLGFPVHAADEEQIDVLAFSVDVLQRGRPLAMTGQVGTQIPRALPTYPVGPVIRVLPPTQRPPAPQDLEVEHAALMREYELPERAPWDPTGWGAFVYANYARPWHALADIYAQMGLDDDAERCRTNARLLTPWGTDPEAP